MATTACASKKKRYLQKVKVEWLREERFKTVFTKFSQHEVKCEICSTQTVHPVLLNVSGRGKPVLSDHLVTDQHKSNYDKINHREPTASNKKMDEFIGWSKRVS